jgi:hypothetical protein
MTRIKRDDAFWETRALILRMHNEEAFLGMAECAQTDPDNHLPWAGVDDDQDAFSVTASRLLHFEATSGALHQLALACLRIAQETRYGDTNHSD